MFPSFHARANLTERMDEPDCCEEHLLQTLRQLASVNRLVSRYRTILKRWVLSDMQRNPDREYHMLDLGAGGCDIDDWLLHRARGRGLNLRVTACDTDPRTVRYAKSMCAGIPGLTILRHNVLTEPVDESVDYLFANHFLHHLSDEDAVALLRRWAPRVRRHAILSDLRRAGSAYLGFSLLSLIYRNSFTREDGLISIRRGFRAHELQALAAAAGLGDRATVHRLIPNRLVLRIDGTDR